MSRDFVVRQRSDTGRWSNSTHELRALPGCVIVHLCVKPHFPQRPQIGHVWRRSPDLFPHILNSLWITRLFPLQNNVSRGLTKRFMGRRSLCYTRRPYGVVPRQAARR